MPIPFRYTGILLLLTIFLTSAYGAQSQLIGDLDGDYSVDFKDLEMFTWQWLEPGCLTPGCIADLDGVNGVNMSDFAILAKNWRLTESHMVISEFMARNNKTLLDGDGQYSDWIEIYNPTDSVVYLNNWYLTDDDTDLTKWQLPNGLKIKPGEFLLVFASEKTQELYPYNYPYLDAGGHYHTNFELDKDGGYLALVEADGVTIVHEYEYPTQLADISYGLAQYAAAFIPTGATVSYHVPTSGDAGKDWTNSDFDDSLWETGTTSIGFGDVGGPSGTILREYWTGIPGASVSDLTSNSNYPDNPSGTSEPTTFEAPINWANEYGTRIHGFLYPPTTGDYTFWIATDDGGELWLSTDTDPANKELIALVPGWSGSRDWTRYPEQQSSSITLTAGQKYYIEGLQKEDGGNDNLAVAWEGPGFVREVIDGRYLSPWTESWITTDVHDNMLGINSSLWTRIEFYIEEGDEVLFDTLTLRIKYEDGFTAYLNGQEIASRNAPDPVEWNSTALTDRPLEDSAVFEVINITAFLGALKSGRNVLAIQGLNDNDNDGNFLILPELVAARNRALPQYFTTPTPEKLNIPGAIGQVGEVWFSHKRGLYDSSGFWLTLSTGTKDAGIRYTLDGSRPSMNYGIVYTTPILINRTSTVRARAYKPGWLDSDVMTHTYIFLNNVLAQSSNPPGFPLTWGGTAADYQMDPNIVSAHAGTIKNDLKSLPSMSLVMNMDDIFGQTGIYSYPTGEGFAWERPGSVELFYPDGTEGFQINCGVRIYGGAFRGMNLTRKKTFRLLFKGMYGPTKLRYPLFGEDAADELDTIILRAGANDAWNNWGGANTQYIVDEFMRRTQLALGYPSAHGTFVHLYINGLYWGLYNPTERPQSSFAANYFGGTKEEWDTNNSGSPCGESSTGTWNTMLNLIRQGMTTTEAYQRIQGNNPDGTNNPAYDDLLDIDNYIAYMFSNFWGGTGDWPHHNYYAGCHRPPNATGFKFFNWDSEGAIIIWSNLYANVTGVNNGAGEPYSALRQNSEFCLLFADHAHRYMLNNGPATSGPSYERYKEMADEVERAIVCESARWGDMASATPYTLSHWQTKRDYILNTYMPQRRDIVFGQLRNAGLYPSDTDAPVFYINGSPQHGGDISTDDEFTLDDPNRPGTTIYYTTDGNDPHLPEDLQITGTTLVVENAPKKVLVPTGSVNDNWKGGGAFDDSGWNDGTFIAGKTGGVGYDENQDYVPYISYDVEALMNADLNPSANNSCYIRIPFTYNGDPRDFNFMTLYIRYDDGFIAYLNGDELERINFPDTSTPAWNSKASGGHEASGLESIPVSGHLDSLKQGDNILAIHGMNTSTTSSDFIISAELVAGEANSTGGISPSAIKYNSEHITFNKSTHIKARVRDGVTWSALNEATFTVGPVAENLRITEIMYHPRNTGDPNDPNTEFIELKNIGPDTLNLNLVRFTKGIDFTFPDVELDPNECIVVVKDRSAFEAQYDTPVKIAGQYTGSLANNGEKIRLEDAIGRTILDFEYKDGWYPTTDGDGFSLTIIDPTDTANKYGPVLGLEAHWKFDDGSGNTAIDSAGTNDGTLNGDPTWTAGKIDGALSFDGAGDYVSFASDDALASESVTVQAWIRLSEFASMYNPIIIQHLGRNGYHFYITSYRPIFFMIGGVASTQATSPDAIETEKWYHIAGTNDGTNIKLYVDGHLKAAAPSTGFLGFHNSAYIGCEPTYLYYYTGLIDDVRTYNRPLSEYDFEVMSDPKLRWSQKESWRASVYRNGTPGADDSGILPNPGAVVINEVMAHSNEGPDWIELYNTTGDPINIGGWFLSDSDRDEPNLTKYRIADDTIIYGDDYLVFYQDTDFNDLSDPGCLVPFGLSENGEEACLSSRLDPNGMLTGYREVEDFGASLTNVSLGRYYKPSTDNFNFVAMDYNTPDANNVYPRVGPVVINEIMYNPITGNQKEEYIELHNITAEPYTLYRLDKFLPWKFTDGIDYVFSASPPVTIPAYGYLMIVKDEASFTARYGSMPGGVQVFEGYSGWLSNSGERLQIAMPGDIDEFGTRYYIRVDRVTYSDGSHPENCPGGVDLWPTGADGRGKSLSRKMPADYGNDVANWKAATPSPGAANP